MSGVGRVAVADGEGAPAQVVAPAESLADPLLGFPDELRTEVDHNAVSRVREVSEQSCVRTGARKRKANSETSTETNQAGDAGEDDASAEDKKFCGAAGLLNDVGEAAVGDGEASKTDGLVRQAAAAEEDTSTATAAKEAFREIVPECDDGEATISDRDTNKEASPDDEATETDRKTIQLAPGDTALGWAAARTATTARRGLFMFRTRSKPN